MTEEIKKDNLKNDVCVIDEFKPEKICNAKCRVCSSDYIEEIHNLRKNKQEYQTIVDTLKDKYNYSISCASLSRHFKNYREQKSRISAEIINRDLVEEATSQAVHTKRLVRLIDIVFDRIEDQINHGFSGFGVSDLEKLMKLRYQVLQGKGDDDDAEGAIFAMFQKASNKYGVDVNQGILFKP